MKQRIDQLAVSPREAVDLVGVSLRTIQNYIRAKQLPARKIGRRTVVELRHLREFLRTDRGSASVGRDQGAKGKCL
jgi:excisionase family DNA binding protein